MTPDEAQNLLDSMLPPFKKQHRRKKANDPLNQNGQKLLLLQMVIDIDTQKQTYDFDKALSDIAAIIQNYSVKANITTKAGTKIVIRPNSVPFLVHQVLFFIAVSCLNYNMKITQKDIIKKLNNYGAPVSHNFFSRMHTTPSQYVSMCKYKQPELVIKYMGQKHNKLSVAIKNLVYQAGKYDVFCDVFGGSGAALLSVDKRKEASYVYNELDPCVYNLFTVLVDDGLYLHLINELESLQNDLNGNGVWLADVDFGQEIKKYGYKNGKIIDSHREVILDGAAEIAFSQEDVTIFLEKLNWNFCNVASDDLSFKYKGEKYDKKKLLACVRAIKTISPKTNLEMFSSDEKLVIEYCRENKCLFFLSGFDGNYYSEYGKKDKRESIYDAYRRFMQYRFYEYYAYFINLKKLLNASSLNQITDKEKVRFAVAEIYYQSFRYRDMPSDYPIIHMNDASVRNNAYNFSQTTDFLKRNFSDVIKEIYKRARRTICDCSDCLEVIEKYRHGSTTTDVKHKYPIFYSDSPYEATTGYKVGDFTPENMKNLIYALRDSGDKFIFSCRAVKDLKGAKRSRAKSKKESEIRKLSGKESEVVGLTDEELEVMEITRQICEVVFEHFLAQFIEKRKKLWVLAFEEGGNSLANLIDRYEIAEIMITNFEIRDFYDSAFPNVKFKGYTFEDFMRIMIKDFKEKEERTKEKEKREKKF